MVRFRALEVASFLIRHELKPSPNIKAKGETREEESTKRVFVPFLYYSPKLFKVDYCCVLTTLRPSGTQENASGRDHLASRWIALEPVEKPYGAMLIFRKLGVNLFYDRSLLLGYA